MIDHLLGLHIVRLCNLDEPYGPPVKLILLSHDHLENLETVHSL